MSSSAKLQPGRLTLARTGSSDERGTGFGSAAAVSAAAEVFAAFQAYNDEFRRITRRAARRFQDGEWKLGQRDAVERIELYDWRVERCIASLVGLLGPHVADKAVWAAAKVEFGTQIAGCPDSEFFKTFFNSLTRKIFKTVGVDPEVEFVALDLEPTLGVGDPPLRRYEGAESLRTAAQGILAQLGWGDIVADRNAAIDQLVAAFEDCLDQQTGRHAVESVEFLEPVFYRATRAFLVGRLLGRDWQTPLVLAFKNSGAGLTLDAVIQRDNEIRMLFGFSRSYFHVDLPHVGAAVRYLQALMPGKQTGELYTVLGRAKQGKTERYRTLFKHLQQCEDQFLHAEGERGMVMIVFALSSWDIVVKVIRDHFAYPKTVSREEVMSKYQFVFKHDRVGRLVDAQEFRRLRIPRGRFAPELLDELLEEAAQTCRLDGEDLIIEHCYIERRLRPLNLYLREVDILAARRAVIDYGQAIRDLARTNVFPGDLLSKNFGVSRHGRVIFYDYDELCLITDCKFRDLPTARFEEDEFRAEPWFHVGPHDVFPEQFINFLGLTAALKQTFVQHHGELLTADYWRGIKACHEAERHLEVVPNRPIVDVPDAMAENMQTA